MAIWTKGQITKVIETDRPLHFVESAKEVKEYYDKEKYALEKDSPIIKELIQEGKLTVDKRILKLQEGYYHIIDIQLKDVEFKSETRQVEIGYVLYKESGEDKEYWNKIYQIKMKPLTNRVSRQSFGNDTIPELVNKIIYVWNFELDENAHSYKVNWHEAESYQKALNDANQAEYLMDKMDDEGQAIECMIDQMNEEAEEKVKVNLRQMESEDVQLEYLLEQQFEQQLAGEEHPLQQLDGYIEDDCNPYPEDFEDQFDESDFIEK